MKSTIYEIAEDKVYVPAPIDACIVEQPIQQERVCKKNGETITYKYVTRKYIPEKRPNYRLCLADFLKKNKSLDISLEQFKRIMLTEFDKEVIEREP